MQDFRCIGLDIFYASSEHSEIFISVFYPNWLIIRKFYLNLQCNHKPKQNNRIITTCVNMTFAGNSSVKEVVTGQ